MKPTDAGALVSEATVEEVHQFSLFDTINGAAQMKTKYAVIPQHLYKIFLNIFILNFNNIEICFYFRQMLTLLEVQNAPTAPISAQYLSRGSLQYEFATEILQTPIQLLKINNAQAQVSLLVYAFFNFLVFI